MQDISRLSRFWPLCWLPNFCRVLWGAANFRTTHCKFGYILAYLKLLQCIADGANSGGECSDAPAGGAAGGAGAERGTNAGAGESAGDGLGRLFRDQSLQRFTLAVAALREQAERDLKSAHLHRRFAEWCRSLCGSRNEAAAATTGRETTIHAARAQ